MGLAHKFKCVHVRATIRNSEVEFSIDPRASAAPVAPPSARQDVEFVELGPEEKVPSPEEMLFMAGADLVEDDALPDDEIEE